MDFSMLIFNGQDKIVHDQSDCNFGKVFARVTKNWLRLITWYKFDLNDGVRRSILCPLSWLKFVLYL